MVNNMETTVFNIDTALHYRGSKFVDDPKLGDIVTQGEDTFIFNGKHWDEIGKPSDYTKPQPKKIAYPTNCKNCGAVMNGYWCDYCGSSYPMYEDTSTTYTDYEDTDIDKKSNFIDIKINLPAENRSIDIIKLIGRTNNESIYNRCYISGFKVDSVYIVEGDNMPDTDGFIKPNGPIATSHDEGEYLDVWFPVYITPNGYCHPDKSALGTITANICFMVRQDARTCKEINDTLCGTIYKNVISMYSIKDNIKEIMFTIKY